MFAKNGRKNKNNSCLFLRFSEFNKKTERNFIDIHEKRSKRNKWKEWGIWAEKEESGRCLLEFAKEVCYTVSITYRKQGGAQNGKEF